MGREFIDIFEQLADSYDESLMGHGTEYDEVFENYDQILTEVASRCSGTTVEIGIGTGNLTKKLFDLGLNVYGIEPAKAMRKIAKSKYPDLTILDGDFLHIPATIKNIDSICSTYAFHHLTDEEKEEAIKLYSRLLPKNGKIIFADTMYESPEVKEEIIDKVSKLGYKNLLNDLQTEYYTTMDTLKNFFEKHKFSVSFSRLNTYVWLIEATKE